MSYFIVEASETKEAIEKSHKKKINPGGEVYTYELNHSQFLNQNLEIDKLYSNDEKSKKGFKKLKDIK